MASVLTVTCPNCLGRAAIRSSRQISRLVTDMVVVCRDYQCGGTYAAQVSVVRTISPSACPHPGVTLPMATPRAPINRRRVADNDNGSGRVETG